MPNARRGISAPLVGERNSILALLLLVGATVLAFWPALHGGFIFDDNVFLTENPLIRAANGLSRFWFSREPADYWPVTSTTLWLEWRLWGMHAAGYHATNLVLHLVEVLLLWRILRRLRAPGAFWAALIFALHPLNAESVAWITQRKNLMAMLFYLLTIDLFLRSEASGASDSPPRRVVDRWLLASLVAFALAMLSKGGVVILPVVLFGLIAWRRRPERRDAFRLAPFLLVAIALAWFESTYSTLDQPLTNTAAEFPARLLRAGAVICFYLGKCVWPADLSFDYGHWQVDTSAVRWWLPLIAVLVVTVLLWLGRRRGTRPLLFAWGYFCLALLPTVGFAEVGFMRYSPVSNHYAHLAIIGVAALAAAGLERLVPPGSWSRLPVRIALIASLTALTWQQSRVYSDGERLYRDTLAHNPASAPAHLNLGVIRMEAGHLDEALPHLEAARRLDPSSAQAHNDFGIAQYRLGNLEAAIREYREALRLNPLFTEAHNNLGATLARSGDLTAAIAEFRTALQIDPEFANARQNLAHAEQLQQSDHR